MVRVLDLGRVLVEFHRAVDSAQQSFANAGPVSAEPHWLTELDAATAELAGVIGARFRDLARHSLIGTVKPAHTPP